NATAVTSFNGTLYIESCTITGTNGIGLFPNSGVGRLFVSDTVIDGITGTAILVEPHASASARLMFDRMRGERTQFAITLVNDSTGFIIAHIRDSISTGSSSRAGVLAVSAAGQGTVSVTVDRSSSTLNGSGVDAEGPSTFVVLGRSTVMSNFNTRTIVN